MTAVRSLHLALLECQGPGGESDVIEFAELLVGHGLVPGAGAWTRDGGTPRPAADVQAHMTAAHREAAGASNARRRGAAAPDTNEWWGTPILRPEQPQIFANLLVSHRGREGHDRWGLFLLVDTASHRRAGLSLEAFCASWGPFLEALGDALCHRTRPAWGGLLPESDEIVHLEAAITRRRLAVGWRTWFGPGYAEVFGRDWLLGLPGRATAIDNDGVRHALEGSLADVVSGSPTAYESIRPYLAAAGVEAFWLPQPPHPRRRRVPVPAEAPPSFAADLREVFGMTLVLRGDRRVKLLPFPWATWSAAEHRLALQVLREAVDADRAAHPAAALHLEFTDVATVPPSLEAVLDALGRAHPHLTWALVTDPTSDPPTVPPPG